MRVQGNTASGSTDDDARHDLPSDAGLAFRASSNYLPDVLMDDPTFIAAYFSQLNITDDTGSTHGRGAGEGSPYPRWSRCD